jgi:tRNA nucleotidyltransferase/poly(A) polymerase
MKTAAEFVMHTLSNAGFEAHMVGGCVRDLCLGREPKDFDITTNALPEQVTSLFDDTIQVGAKFGVVVVVVNSLEMDDSIVSHQIEVATYRADGDYSDGRRPDEIHYSKTVQEDVQRRDFTMNGLLIPHNDLVFDLGLEDVLNENTGEFFSVLDYVGGLEDIKNKVIRCIGDPNKRFEEDALRMLRAVRFVAQLGFTIEEDTFKAIMNNAARISNVSRERIADELKKLVIGKFAMNGLAILAATGLFSHIFTPVATSQHNMTQTLERFAKYPTTDPILGLAMLMAGWSGGYKDHEYISAVRSLKLSNKDENTIIGAIEHVWEVGAAESDAQFKLLARKPGIAAAVTLFEQELGLSSTLLFAVEAGMNQVLRFRALTPEDIYPTPMVTGQDLIDMGLKPSSLFGTILSNIEEKQLNGDFKTPEEAIDFVKHSFGMSLL